MRERWRTRKQRAAIVLAAGLAAVVLAAVLAAMAMARPLAGFFHIRTNLSHAATRVSAYPDLAVSPDGNWVTAVWTEGYDEEAGLRGHVYLRAASEAGGGWGNKVAVFTVVTGTNLAYAYNASVAVTGATAHVAYVVFQFEGIELVQTQVRYRTCSLTGGQCGDWQSVFAETNTNYLITQVDIALDTDGDPHVVWARHDKAGNEGDIFYETRDAGGWGGAERVDSGAASLVDSAPAIAWEGGYAHVVWERSGGYIRYRRREDASRTWDGVISIVGPEPDYPPGNPDVAARAGHVFVVWDWCIFPSGYNLVYSRSEVTGSVSFSAPREVGTDKTGGWEEYYYSTDNVDSLPDRDEYLLDLQPFIALNEAGGPAVVWHVDRSGGNHTDYAIYYSYALTGTGAGVNWITSTVLSRGQPTMLGSAAIGIGEPEAGGEQHLHVAYMQKLSSSAWDVYYDSNEWDRYPHVYMPLVMRAD